MCVFIFYKYNTYKVHNAYSKYIVYIHMLFWTSGLGARWKPSKKVNIHIYRYQCIIYIYTLYIICTKLHQFGGQPMFYLWWYSLPGIRSHLEIDQTSGSETEMVSNHWENIGKTVVHNQRCVGQTKNLIWMMKNRCP